MKRSGTEEMRTQLKLGQGGLAIRLIEWLRQKRAGRGRALSRLALLDRIALAPKQSLALVEVDGRRFLVATSQEGAPAFCALPGGGRSAEHRAQRVSW
jgi:flagellar biogenesis protein FliO